ncbi:MAG: hypothetical protein CMP07_10680 [Xanthomonadales bacterium]|nr:hypothetical protein [Xanthomonadales bacterium]
MIYPGSETSGIKALKSGWGVTFLLGWCGWLAADELPQESLRVGGDAASPPFEWTAGDGSIEGFNVELMRLIGAPEGLEVEFQLGSWPETLAALDRGELDIVPMFVSDQRLERYSFTTVYYYQTHALFSRPGLPPIEDIDRIGGLDLVVEARSFAAGELERLDGDSDPELSSNTLEALRTVVDGRADYALLAAPVARELIRRNGWDIERKSVPFWPRGYAFAVRRDNQALADWLQARLATLMGNGEFLELYANWSERLEVGSDYSPDYVAMVQWLLAATGAALLLIAAWNLGLRRQVAQRTRMIREELRHRKRAERQAREMSRRESTTGLANVRHFRNRVDRLLADRSDSARREVMLVRLLDFDSVLRSFGYQVAESMIDGFAQALRETFSPPIAYLGRGTFAVFSETGNAGQQLDALEDALKRVDVLVYPRFVCGSAFAPDDACDSTGLMQKAELAMAESQSLQRRWTPYVDSLQSDPMDIRIIESFRNDRIPGLGFAFQPQLELPGNSVCGCELLARWNHPELGELSPARFVPLLEGAGLTGKLSQLGLGEAVDVSSALRALGLETAVSVNVSTRDLLEPEFFHRVAALLRSRSIPESKLKLEITETSLLQDRDAVRSNLDRLAELGVTISIDDFGTGYSSLDYISRFPVSEVKIDRMFVSRMLASRRDRSIVRSTIHMAHEMDMSVVAEGVETSEHLDVLREFGCDIAQGWAIGYPQPRAEFVELLRSGR